MKPELSELFRLAGFAFARLCRVRSIRGVVLAMTTGTSVQPAGAKYNGHHADQSDPKVDMGMSEPSSDTVEG